MASSLHSFEYEFEPKDGWTVRCDVMFYIDPPDPDVGLREGYDLVEATVFHVENWDGPVEPSDHEWLEVVQRLTDAHVEGKWPEIVADYFA